MSMSSENPNNWPLWEVFIQSKRGLDHKHVGSVHATDARWRSRTRVTCTRDGRKARASGWCRPAPISASQPDDAAMFFDPADDKTYRHPTFYVMPEGAKYI